LLQSLKALPLTAALTHGIGTPLVIGLAYHGSTAARLSGLDNVWGKHIDAATFEAHLQFLTRHYRIITVSELVAALKSGAPLPRKSVFITFDDGYVGNYDVAFPLLKKYGARASFYIATSFIESGKRYPLDVIDAALKYSPPVHGGTKGGLEADALAIRTRFKSLPETEQDAFLNTFAQERGFANAAAVPELGEHARFMTWAQLREMQSAGMEFGSHTHRHYIIARVSADAAREELRESKRLLESNLQAPCGQFCYPNGHNPQDGNAATNDLVRAAGYDCALYMSGGANTKRTSPFMITRCGVGLRTTVAELAAICAAVGSRLRSFAG
jgi:peptidoglycan/xylan/chitin deacetylase (PgdA/CDA1 family)